MNLIIHIAQGLGIGVANVIAGVSGGTMALVFGIYDRLIEIVSAVVQAFLALVRFDVKAFVSRLTSLPWTFILPLATGIVVATLTGARVIPEAMDKWPVQSRSLFFGLILGSIAIPWIRTKTVTLREYVLVVVAAALAFVLTGLPPTEISDPSLLQFFLAGAIAICAMILPGVSGAFLLLVMGLYQPVLRAIDELDMFIVSAFLAGSAIGLGAFALFMGWLLRKYHDQTMVVLVGLMAGSLRALWPWLGEERELLWYSGNEALGGVILLFAAGLILSGLATLYEAKKVK